MEVVCLDTRNLAIGGNPANGFPARLLADLIVLSSRYVVYHES